MIAPLQKPDLANLLRQIQEVAEKASDKSRLKEKQTAFEASI
jgi:hypothetical protein